MNADELMIFALLIIMVMDYKNQQEGRHRCLECGDKIMYGRTDKKFCCEACRIKHYNDSVRHTRAYRRKIIAILSNNYRILEEIMQSGTKSIDLTDLVSLGFSPYMMTSCHKVRRHDEFGCFDIKYKMSGTRVYSISKIQNVSLTLRTDIDLE